MKQDLKVLSKTTINQNNYNTIQIERNGESELLN